MSDEITEAMAAVMRASSATTEWSTQRRLLATYAQLAEARRESMRGAIQQLAKALRGES